MTPMMSVHEIAEQYPGLTVRRLKKEIRSGRLKAICKSSNPRDPRATFLVLETELQRWLNVQMRDTEEAFRKDTPKVMHTQRKSDQTELEALRTKTDAMLNSCSS